ncbi:MAG TPA: hypothetical protein VJ809_18270 [Pirellulales bacterium]|nr:hypothetical protein [Pirellulales bacterium]
MLCQEKPLSVVLGYVVPPTLWLSSFAVMAYGIWNHEWYGFMMAALFATLGILVLVFLYRAQRLSDAEVAEIERMAREWDEGDYPP